MSKIKFNKKEAIIDVTKTLRVHRFIYDHPKKVDEEELIAYISEDIKKKWKIWLEKFEFESQEKLEHFIFTYYTTFKYGKIQNIIRDNNLIIEPPIKIMEESLLIYIEGKQRARHNLFGDFFNRENFEDEEFIKDEIENVMQKFIPFLEMEANIFFKNSKEKRNFLNYILKNKAKEKKFRKWIFSNQSNIIEIMINNKNCHQVLIQEFVFFFNNNELELYYKDLLKQLKQKNMKHFTQVLKLKTNYFFDFYE